MCAVHESLVNAVIGLLLSTWSTRNRCSIWTWLVIISFVLIFSSTSAVFIVFTLTAFGSNPWQQSMPYRPRPIGPTEAGL